MPPVPDYHRVGIIGIDGFSLMSMASTIEPLRVANEIAGTTLYELIFLSSSASGRASAGLAIPGAVPLRGAGALDFVFTIAGGDPFAVKDRQFFEWLREQDDEGAYIGGISGGPVLLARAGLMDGYRMTLNWSHRERLLEMNSQLILSRAAYVRDRNRLTSVGGVSPAEMMNSIISSHQGADFAREVRDWFLQSELTQAQAAQQGSIAERYGARDRYVQTAIQYMRDSLGEKFSLDDLARNCNLSKRQLTRRFIDDIGETPMRFANRLRLETGRELLSATKMTVTEIAFALDFSSSAHFTTLFKQQYGETPSAARGAA